MLVVMFASNGCMILEAIESNILIHMLVFPLTFPTDVIPCSLRVLDATLFIR